MGKSLTAPDPVSPLFERKSLEFGEGSAPTCFTHDLYPSQPCELSAEVSSSKGNSSLAIDSDCRVLKQWRRDTRVRLIEKRMAVSFQDRFDWSKRISEELARLLASNYGKLIGIYWPFRGEYDARPLLTSLKDQGIRLALPVVVAKAQPLQFREWWPGVAMTRGVWNIPIPEEGASVCPEIVIAPLVGFDPRGYRLGYGGGFYDRTLASMAVEPLCIGVGFEFARLATIHPRPHDIPMDIVVTEGSTWRRDKG